MRKIPLAFLACRSLRCVTTRLILAMLCVAVLCPVPVSAAGYMYAGKRKTINCGILKLGSSTGGNWKQPLNPSFDSTSPGVGDLFNYLDYRTDLKPAGWSFDNPYAPVDGQGRKYTKDNPLFWQVKLDTARNLNRMHVLYLPVEGNVQLKPEDREQLRKFVDSGGVLWIDNVNSANELTFTATGAPTTTDAGTFFMPNFYFEQASAGYDVPWSRHNPLLTMPYWLDDSEVMMIGTEWGKSSCHPGYDVNGSKDWAGFAPPLMNDVLFPIVAKNDGTDPSVVANAYGSGRIVATSNFAGRGCFLPYPHSQPSLKFAYNVIAWASSWTDLRKNPRRGGGGIDTVGGSSLVKLWSLPGSTPSGESGAVIYKNVAFYSSGNTLFALDVLPSEDLDHDGIADDGAQDRAAALNSGQDVIWTAPCDGLLSSPTVVTCQDPLNANRTREAVLVMSEKGTVYMFDAFPNTNGKLGDAPLEVAPHWATYATPKPNPPIFMNGWVYAAAGNGRLYAVNPAMLKWKAENPDKKDVPSDWVVPGIALDTYTTLKAGPNFGYVQASNTGAVVGMVYWCVSAPDTGDSSIQREQNDFIYGLPVTVKNDRLKLRNANSTHTLTEFQTSFPDIKMTSAYPDPDVRIQCSDLGVQEQKIYPNSGLVNDTVVQRFGYIVVETNKELPVDAAVFADYAVDYPSTTVTDYNRVMPRIRAPLQPSSIGNGSGGPGGNQVPKTEIPAMPAMGPDNVLFINGVRDGGQFGAGGSVYGIKNDGSSGQSTKWNYMLHSGVTPAMLQGVTNATLPIPGLLSRKPMSVDELPAITIRSPQPTSSPVIWGDKVFVTVSGQGGGGALLCLKASSDFVVRIIENAGTDVNGSPIKRPKRLYDSATGRPLQIKLWQPNLLCGPSGLGPSVEAVSVPGNMIDRERGTISFPMFDRLKLRGGQGVLQETNTFSSSLPVWVLLDEVELPIDWTTWGPTMSLADPLGGKVVPPQTDCVDLSGWNNLLWYYAPPNCTGIHSSPVLIGNNVYFITDEGVLYAVDAETGETRGAQVDPLDPSNVNWQPDPKFMIWRENIEPGPVPMPTQGVNVSASGSNGVLLVPGPLGLCAYANPSTLIADSNRLVEVDSSGSVTWSLDSVMLPVNIPAIGRPDPGTAALPRRKVQVNRPARARYTDAGEILLVNSGSNLVCKTDKSGNIAVQMIKTLGSADGWIRMAYDRFADPKGLLRPGQPRELTSPTDALVWQEAEKGPNNQVGVMHCLIADSGNSRVLDLVYRFNATGQLMNSARDEENGYYLPELNWVSNTESKAEKYVFECLQVVPRIPGDPRVVSVWAAISNYRTDPNTPNPQGLGGAVVELKYRTWDAASGTWNYSGPDSGAILSGCERVDIGGSPQPLACPRYFQVIDRMEGRFVLLCDNRGVYKISVPSDPSVTPVVVQSLLDKAYRLLDRDPAYSGDQPMGAPLLAGSAQELPNGKWLIANSYSGTDTSGTASFHGEVLEYDPNKNVVTWCTPKLTPLREDPDNPPVITGWKQKMGTSYNLQQPRSAFRQF